MSFDHTRTYLAISHSKNCKARCLHMSSSSCGIILKFSSSSYPISEKSTPGKRFFSSLSVLRLSHPFPARKHKPLDVILTNDYGNIHEKDCPTYNGLSLPTSHKLAWSNNRWPAWMLGIHWFITCDSDVNFKVSCRGTGHQLVGSYAARGGKGTAAGEPAWRQSKLQNLKGRMSACHS